MRDTLVRVIGTSIWSLRFRNTVSVATEYQLLIVKSPFKPFFIMDWLKEMIQDKDVETIGEMLEMPRKSLSFPCPGTPRSSNRRLQCRSWNDHVVHVDVDSGDILDLQTSPLANPSTSTGYSPSIVECKRIDRSFFEATVAQALQRL